MKAFLPAILLASLFMPQLCAAQNEASLPISRQSEKTLREQCIASNHADMCTQWTAIASCTMTYREHLPEVARLYSDAELQKFRQNAATTLPQGCPMIAQILLQIDMLHADLALKDDRLSNSKRRDLWLKIIEMANHSEIIPQQHQLIASEIIHAPDFQALMEQPKVRRFIVSTSDEAFALLPNISDETASFLNQLDIIESTAVTMRGSIVLALLDLRNSRHLSAKQRLLDIDPTQLTEAEIQRIAPEIRKNGIHLAKPDNFMDDLCLSEIEKNPRDNHAKWLYQLMMDINSDSAIYVLQSATGPYLRSCDFEAICSQLAKIWATRYTNPDVRAYTDDLIRYIENHPNPELIRSFVKNLASAAPAPLSAFKQKYGARVSRLAGMLAEFDIDAKTYDKAQMLLSDAIKLVPETDSCPLRLQYGRALHFDKKRIQARQLWGYIIEHDTNTSCREFAYTLSIQSLLSDGKKAEASALEKQWQQ